MRHDLYYKYMNDDSWKLACMVKSGTFRHLALALMLIHVRCIFK